MSIPDDSPPPLISWSLYILWLDGAWELRTLLAPDLDDASAQAAHLVASSAFYQTWFLEKSALRECVGYPRPRQPREEPQR